MTTTVMHALETELIETENALLTKNNSRDGR